MGSLEFWYRSKFNLTIHDPRYLEATIEEIETEYWTFFYAENPEGKHDAEDDDFDVENEIARMSDDDWQKEF